MEADTVANAGYLSEQDVVLIVILDAGRVALVRSCCLRAPRGGLHADFQTEGLHYA